MVIFVFVCVLMGFRNILHIFCLVVLQSYVLTVLFIFSNVKQINYFRHFFDTGSQITTSLQHSFTLLSLFDLVRGLKRVNSSAVRPTLRPQNAHLVFSNNSQKINQFTYGQTNRSYNATGAHPVATGCKKNQLMCYIQHPKMNETPACLIFHY